MLRKPKSCLMSDEVEHQVYYDQVQIVLSNGVTLWGNSTHNNKIFILQKRAVRLMCNAPFRAHFGTLFKNGGSHKCEISKKLIQKSQGVK